MITIALVDDHILLRESLAIMLNRITNFEVLIQANNGSDLITQLQTASLPDLVLTDISMPLMDGMEITKWLRRHHKQIKVIALSMHAQKTYVKAMFKCGADAYLLKDMDPDDLADAICQVYYAGRYENPRLLSFLNEKNGSALLNERELTFLRWTCSEKNHKQIAIEMCVSPRTVDGYRDALFRKMNVGSKVGMVIYAIKNDLILLK